MKTTYIQKDVKLRLSLLNGEDDPNPKSRGISMSLRVNLVEATLIGAGIALAGMMLHECCSKASEVRALRRIAKQKQKDTFKF